jgi:hypothetical protein
MKITLVKLVSSILLGLSLTCIVIIFILFSVGSKDVVEYLYLLSMSMLGFYGVWVLDKLHPME